MRLHRLLYFAEWNEIVSSRSYWLLMLMTGPLVGNGFINAVDLYAEASGIHGGMGALSQGLTPLDGILVPTFGAYDLVVTLIFPFVAIRTISNGKEDGSLKLALQFPVHPGTMVMMKVFALMAGWLLAWIPGLIAITLWKTYGGHLYLPETLNLILGHWLRMLLAAGIAMAAASLTESAASAAIVALGFTLGTWVLDFVANGRGGLLQQMATYTPTAALRFFEQGTLRAKTCLVELSISFAAIAIVAIFIHPGHTVRTRLGRLFLLLALLASALLGAEGASSSLDLSEDRRNSFPRDDEMALRTIKGPLKITILLAAEDPRLMDYERGILNKLRRIMPGLEVEYGAQSRTGLFEGATDNYGEIWYELDGRRVMSRSTTEPIVLEQLYQLANLPQPHDGGKEQYPGYPLAVHPRFAGVIFYLIWPVSVILIWAVRFWTRRSLKMAITLPR